MYRLGRPHRLGFPQRLLLNRSRRARRFVTAAQPDFGEYQVILPHEPFVWGTSHIKPRPVPQHIPWPAYALAGGESEELPNSDPYRGDGIIPLGGEEEARLRRAATLAKKVRQYVGTIVKPGITTNSIDAAVHDFIVSHSAYPSPLRYQSFPRSCCTSVNNIIAHGVPDDRPLQEGDIVNVDITVFLDGYHGDTSQTFLVGQVDKQGQDLVRAANDALHAGINACGPGRPLKGIGNAIHAMARSRQMSVSSQFTGHGIGTFFHRPPWIIHTANDEPGFMTPGLCFTVEPCIVQGCNPNGWIFPDGWTASTENCARSAQAEHMILITNDSIDVLTA